MRNGSIARKLGRLGRRFGSTGTSVTLSSELVAKLLIAAELSIKKKSLNKRKLKIKKKIKVFTYRRRQLKTRAGSGGGGALPVRVNLTCYNLTSFLK